MNGPIYQLALGEDFKRLAPELQECFFHFRLVQAPTA